MNKKVNFLNIPIDAITMRETLNRVEQVIASNQQIHHTVVNAGKVVLMQTDEKLEKFISQRIKVSNFITFTKHNE
jgi:N-acetylglucosaminyldiphosphoundecaprenol N-acetyl-beta-D-mannosaminyltransferase